MIGTNRHSFTKKLDATRIKDAVAKAESRTSGEIVVSVSTYFWGSVQKAAERTFERLGVWKTRDRNGVLIFIVPGRRQFVLLGDHGVHAKVGQEFWDRVAAAISERFHKGDLTGALVDGIESIGEQLAAHFPHQGHADRNELADEPEVK